MPRPKPAPTAKPYPPRLKSQPAPTRNLVEVVNPLWLLKAIGFTILGALVCGYITLCLLFYQGQWQLILHPQRTDQPLNTLASLPAEEVHFDTAESGLPQLSGAYLPAAAATRYSGFTVLYLRGGDSSLVRSPQDAQNLTILHALGLNLFAFDYRGFGQSAPIHPSQLRMAEDATAALRYLRDARAIPEEHIVLFGSGVGSALATQLAIQNPSIPALILDAPGPDPLSIALADPRVRSLPVRFLFKERFSLHPLATLPTPKLLISYPAAPPAFLSAATPKTTLELPQPDKAALQAGISRFLDQTLR
jgi:pimeloyl-ACP methyl ester carboxylesterase